ncbi:AraC family transcriptional regulator [Stakelama pacifica]|uniref:AraC family transcriptional regulator n=1 Tax=Stakelama pacifica TaxID=517720 RepID=A0A4R6FQ43_9SPHN|nr:AraC family transcriptional regulator [Stakelama pacifica]TDN82825.1 AraC family transcriptional regulator [Stakelama pacifica]GGO95484.1 AraC family transcriptional regulator [Stakelama pacifica]
MILSSSSKVAVDPLSDALIAFGSGSVQATRLEAAGDWSLGFASRNRLKFIGVIRGKCCLVFPDHDPEWLEEGDVALIGRTDYIVASDPSLEPAHGAPLYAASDEDTLRLGGDDVLVIGSSVGLDDAGAGFVLDALPSFYRIAQGFGEAETISRLLAFVDREARIDRPGSRLVAMRLAELLLIEGVRAFIATEGALCAGWIGALGDKQVGAALTLIHAHPERQWTVPGLAAEVGLSRSGFSERFSRRVGRPPLDYLRQWRMMLARRLLAQNELSADQVARRVGYSSQSAFGFAYKRTFGSSPKRSA